MPIHKTPPAAESPALSEVRPFDFAALCADVRSNFGLATVTRHADALRAHLDSLPEPTMDELADAAREFAICVNPNCGAELVDEARCGLCGAHQ